MLTDTKPKKGPIDRVPEGELSAISGQPSAGAERQPVGRTPAMVIRAGQVWEKGGKRRAVKKVQDISRRDIECSRVGEVYYVVWGRTAKAASQLTWWVQWERALEGAVLVEGIA